MKLHFIILRVMVIGVFSYGCDGIKQKKDTHKNYANTTTASKSLYGKDSSTLIKGFYQLLLTKEAFFANKSYFDATQLIIDSILYGPDHNKLAVFIMTKNPINRQSVPDNKYTWYYDATCYLGVRKNDTIILSWIGPSFTNSYSQTALSKIIRNSYFTDFATKDTIGRATYPYNLDDIRFWNSSIWQEIEEKRKRKIQFEAEKRNHPENVYEPKK